jgi:hypothetical protein
VAGSDIGVWLRSLGLEQDEAVLRDNEIDDAVLHNLTEDHFREPAWCSAHAPRPRTGGLLRTMMKYTVPSPVPPNPQRDQQILRRESHYW